MLCVYRSNDMENLARRLCEIIRDEPGPGVFEPEWVIVPSVGLKRWLSAEIAKFFGICAHVRFMLPEEAVEAIASLLPGEETAPILDAQTMTLLLLELFNEVKDEDSFLAACLREVGPVISRREVAVARQLATVFDRYTVHRPHMLARWDSGAEPNDWQANLWRKIRRCAAGARHRGERTMALIKELQEDTFSSLPCRIFLFGITTLARLHLDFFAALSRHIACHLFVFTPSKEWFADATPTRAATAYGEAPEDPHPFLRYFGKVSRDFQGLLVDVEVAYEQDLYRPEGQRQTLLGLLQDDILLARCPTPKHSISAQDRSLQVHACHSPMRQVEVLRDVLLDLFQKHPDLYPRDVLVMTPDIETYAPLVEAVFSAPISDGKAIPYRVCDAPYWRENSVAEVIRRFLLMAQDRVTASQIFDFLCLKPVLRKFDLTTEDAEICAEFLRTSQVRFGIDQKHRRAMNFPDDDLFTFQFGLERLLVGLAMESENEHRMFGGVVPCDRSAVHRETFARFVAFARHLLRHLNEALRPATLVEWVERCRTLLADLVSATDEDEIQTQEVLRELNDLLHVAGAMPSRPLEAHAFLALYEGIVDGRRRMPQLFSGAVTFAALVPMRTIPFRVIALLGVEERSFPRRQPPNSFDKMFEKPELGDRTARDEDLETFLDTILSAKDYLLIFYTGRGIRDNAEIPPAVPVGQLLDVVKKSFEITDGSDVLKHILYDHAIHPFSPRNYGPPFRSYDALFEPMAKALARGGTVGPLQGCSYSVPAGTEQESPKTKTVSLDEIAWFLSHPVRFFCLRNGFEPRVEGLSLQDAVPLDLSGLDEFSVGDEILQAKAQDSQDRQKMFTLLLRSGKLPPGLQGEVVFGELWRQAMAIMRRAKVVQDCEPRQIEACIEIGDWSVVGRIKCLFGSKIVWTTFAKGLEKRILELWVHHLFALLADEQYSGQAYLYARKGGAVISEAKKDQAREKAERVLCNILKYYAIGHLVPIPFFAASSLEYLRNPNNVLKTWSSQHNGEMDDPYVKYIFGELEAPWDAKVEGLPPFAEISRELLGHLCPVLNEVTYG